MADLVDVVFTGEITQLKTVPSGKFKERRDKNNRVIFRQAILHDKEVVVPPAAKEFKYYDADKQREMKMKVVWQADDKGVYHAHYEGVDTPGVAPHIAEVLDRSKNFKIKKIAEKAPAKTESK